MPLTVPTHPASVLPLKFWRPHWFDGVAPVLGSTAPELGYAFDGVRLGLWRLGHSWLGLIVWSLPLTLASCDARGRAASGKKSIEAGGLPGSRGGSFGQLP